MRNRLKENLSNSSRITVHASPAFIDTHCHLEMTEFDEDRDKVIQRARGAGIEAVITVGSDMKGNIGSLRLSEKYDFIYAAVGIHPHDAKDFTEEIYNQLKEWGTNPPSPPFTKGGQGGINSSLVPRPSSLNKVVAIGETGLDYHYDNSPRDIQKEVFKRHLLLAKELGLPVIIHSREAKKDTLEILADSGINNGVLHCFSGDMDMAEKAMAMGFYISIAGPVTFKNANKLREITEAIPDDYLLIETDAPYLTPEPFRGKRNEPSFLVNTAEKIAEVRRVSFEDIARITTLNARRLFRIGKSIQQGEIAYKIRDSLYLNITNRCTNKCSFCVRFHSDYVKGHNLRLSVEPTEEELKAAIGDPVQYKEIVFCGYGEPFLRLDIVKNLARWIKERGGKVRINTNGHGSIINRRNILPELRGFVDVISVSLDAQDEKAYDRICAPDFKDAFHEVILFIRESKKYIPDVLATVVEMEGVDVEKCRKITDELGVKLRVRKLDVVG
ncbi:MAG: YchF/TatD family DNA exonuclease [Thermodesulfovibrionales bacterium]|nr:YchF/TatD family DNA exonuclease [Thermodesulfovibrionales bacterium]